MELTWTVTCGYCGHAADGAEQESALAAFGDHFAERHPDLSPSTVWSHDGPPFVRQPPVDLLIVALEAMPPDQPVTASELLAIIRPDTMTADAPASIPEPPAAGA